MDVVVPINYVAVLAAAVASIVLGFLWYGPIFGKPWMKMMGFTKDSMDAAKKKGMVKSYLLMSIGSLVMAYVLAHSLVFASAYTKTVGVSAGLMVGFWSWLGFVAPVKMGDQLWGGKPWMLFVIEAGYYFVSLCAMGVILAMM
ncbi:DUF1761 domain-containing protein [Patescibacteria group bacterium]|nr:MAG: DUF1761 domain-containing protein [Patescibacteria group bacterium]